MGFSPGRLLFLIYINDLNQAIKFSRIHHFLLKAFNKFLSTVAKDIDSKIISTNKTHKDYLNASLVNSFSLTPINNEEVNSLIKETSRSLKYTHQYKKTLMLSPVKNSSQAN